MDDRKFESIFLFAESDLFVRAGDGSAYRGGPGHGPADEQVIGLSVKASRDFIWAGSSWSVRFLDEAGVAEAQSRRLARLPIRQAIGLWPEESIRPALKGLALLNWLAGARFCGACATALVDVDSDVDSDVDLAKPDGDLRGSGARICPACRRPHFPRISPAVIVLVRRGRQALLARNARMPPGGRFGLLAGFVEAGESLEEAAIREVREEAGIEIGNLRYRKSQPWPFPDSLMLAYTADWVSGEARPDGVEIAELRWCMAGDLPEIPPRGSVARDLLDDFVRESEG